MRPPRCVRTISMRLAIVKRSLTRLRNRRSGPLSGNAAPGTVDGQMEGGACSPFVRVRACANLEIDISGVTEQRRFDGNVQAVVYGVVELPEPDYAGELDDLLRLQMLPQPLQNFVRN